MAKGSTKRGGDEATRRLATTLQLTADAVMGWSAEGGITFANGRTADWLGTDATELVGTPWAALFAPEDSAALSHRLGALTGQSPVAVIEARLRNDPSHRDIRWTVGAAFDDRSALVEHIAVGHDLGAERRAVDARREQERVAREAHHRVKNNLQLAASLVSMGLGRLGGSDVDAVVRETQARLQTIALVHERFRYVPSGGRAPARELLLAVADLVRSFHLGPRPSLDLEIGSADVDFELGMAVCRVAYELLANAHVHAFSAPGGHIRLTLAIRGAGVELEVRDDGVGLPLGFEIGRLETIGLRLCAGIAAQRGGTLALDGQGGVAATVWLPSEGTT